MSEYGDYSDDGSDHEWMYVEDHYDEADELAEHTCHSPVYDEHANIRAEDYDVYDYFEDLEYLSDGYYDEPSGPAARHGNLKRKAAFGETDQGGKRQKLTTKSRSGEKVELDKDASPEEHAIIVWKTKREDVLEVKRQSGGSGVKSVALLKDWKERFKDVPGLSQLHKDKDIKGDGFELNDIQSVAEMLSEESIQALKEMLSTKGLNPEAVEVVLQDIISGNDRSFDGAEGDENADDKDENENDDADAEDDGIEDEPVKDTISFLARSPQVASVKSKSSDTTKWLKGHKSTKMDSDDEGGKGAETCSPKKTYFRIKNTAQ